MFVWVCAEDLPIVSVGVIMSKYPYMRVFDSVWCCKCLRQPDCGLMYLCAYVHTCLWAYVPMCMCFVSA